MTVKQYADSLRMPKKNQKARPHRRPMMLWTFLLLIFIGEMLFNVWCRVQCIRVGYEIAATGKKEQALIAMGRNLEVEVASLRTPERIARLAARLGLSMPAAAQVMVLP